MASNNSSRRLDITDAAGRDGLIIDETHMTIHRLMTVTTVERLFNIVNDPDTSLDDLVWLVLNGTRLAVNSATCAQLRKVDVIDLFNLD